MFARRPWHAYAGERILQRLEEGHEVPYGEDVRLHEDAEIVYGADAGVEGMIGQAPPERGETVFQRLNRRSSGEHTALLVCLMLLFHRHACDFTAIVERVIRNDDGYPWCVWGEDMRVPDVCGDLPLALPFT